MTRVVLVCEGVSDPPVAVALAKRVLLEHIDWLDGVPDAMPVFQGLRENDDFLKWASVKGEYDNAGEDFRRRRRGFHGQGLSRTPDAENAERAIRLIRFYVPNAAAVVFVRDTDNSGERKQGLEMIRKNYSSAISISVGIANPKIEAWILAGFEPDEEEIRRVNEFHQTHGVHPIKDSHRLRAADNADVRNAKNVVAHLMSDYPRRAKCWEDTSFEVLRRHGQENGLSDFLDELEGKDEDKGNSRFIQAVRKG
jgi:hypothetical protein